MIEKLHTTVTALPCEFQKSIVWRKVYCFLPNVGGSEKASCVVWQLECHASNITASDQSDHHLHGYTLPVFFGTD